MFESVRRKAHFKARLKGVQSAIWDMEFSRAKLRMIRENLRQQYDRIRETSENAKRALEAEKAKETPDRKNIENLERVTEKYAPDLEYMTKQLDAMDKSIDSDLTDEKGNPIAITQKIEAARTLKDMLKEYVKTL